MEGLIDAGQMEYEPLLELRDWLQAVRDHPEYRQSQRRNGDAGTGPFTLEAREKILARLLKTQSRVGYPLISQEEIDRIHEIWASDLVVTTKRLFHILDRNQADASYSATS